MVTWNTAWSSPFCTPVFNRAEIYTSIWDSEHSRSPFCQAIFHWNLLQNQPWGVNRARVESTIQVHAGLPQPAVVMVTERVVRWQSTTNGRQARQGFGEQLWVIGLQKEKKTMGEEFTGFKLHCFMKTWNYPMGDKSQRCHKFLTIQAKKLKKCNIFSATSQGQVVKGVTQAFTI